MSHPDPALATSPDRSKYPTELGYCRAMQRWAAQEVDPRNNQRAICIDDWFAEEFLITTRGL